MQVEVAARCEIDIRLVVSRLQGWKPLLLQTVAVFGIVFGVPNHASLNWVSA